MRRNAPVGQSDVRDLAERHGLAVERYAFEMHRPLTDPPAVPEVPGVRVTGWEATGVREGYPDEPAVARSHRGRGIAGALLQKSMDSANPSGALRLYERLGHRQRAGSCVHQLSVPATGEPTA